MKNKVLIFGLLMAMVVGGCGRQEEDDVMPGSSTEVREDKDREAEAVKGEVTGSINTFTGSILSITDEMGETYELDVKEAKLDCPRGILAGEQVKVSYEGNLEEDPRVLKVSNLNPQKGAKKATITGILEDITNNTLTVQTEDSGSVTLTTIGAEFLCKKGLGKGTPVKVIYLGEIRNGSSRNVKVLSVTDWKEGDKLAEEISGEAVTQSPEPTPESAPEVTGEPGELVADILTVEGETMTVVTGEEEKEYKFPLTHAKIRLKYGLLQGSEIRITYRGNLDGGEILTEKIADVDPNVVNEETGGFTVVGTVMAWGNHVMTIMSNDGVQITCTTEGAKMEEEHPKETDYIKIIIKPGKKSNIYQALDVEYM